MAIFKTHGKTNPVVADELAERPYPTGDRAGDFVAPDFPIDAELVDKMTTVEHKLHLDDLRAPGAAAKTIEFEGPPTKESISVVEHAQKSTLDSREIEDAGKAGITLLTDRAELHRNDVLDVKEYRISAMSTTTGNFPSTHREAGLNFKTENLILRLDDVQEKIKKDGRWGKAKFGLMGTRTFRAMRANEGFAKFCASNPGTFGVQESGSRQRNLIALATYLELDELRVADFSRVLGNDTDPTEFWPTDFFLVFGREKTTSTRTFAQTVVVPYGTYQDVAEGTLVDVRTDKLSGTDELMEVGAYHRYRTYLLNANQAFLFTEIEGWELS
jgi:hypothetical protein